MSQLPEVKEHVFRVVPNGANNMTHHIPLCYYHKKRGRFVWLDEFHNEQSSSSIPKGTNIQMLRLDETNNGYEVRYSSTDSAEEIEHKKKIITFFKEWPEVAKYLPDGNVDSYPSDNHQAQFAAFYAKEPHKALPQTKQALRYIDEEEQIKLSAEEKRKKVSITTAMGSIINDQKKLMQICYLLGENPYGADADEMFSIVYDVVLNGDKGERFLEIMQSAEWNDRLLLAVKTAIVRGIITESESGMFQFLGQPISKLEREIPAYFKFNPAQLVELKYELKEAGQDFDDVSVNQETGEVESAASTKKRGRAAAEVTTTSENP
jgi:hypothetical protein